MTLPFYCSSLHQLQYFSSRNCLLECEAPIHLSLTYAGPIGYGSVLFQVSTSIILIPTFLFFCCFLLLQEIWFALYSMFLALKMLFCLWLHFQAPRSNIESLWLLPFELEWLDSGWLFPRKAEHPAHRAWPSRGVYLWQVLQFSPKSHKHAPCTIWNKEVPCKCWNCWSLEGISGYWFYW